VLQSGPTCSILGLSQGRSLSAASHIGTSLLSIVPPPSTVHNLENKGSNFPLCARSLNLEEFRQNLENMEVTAAGRRACGPFWNWDWNWTSPQSATLAQGYLGACRHWEGAGAPRNRLGEIVRIVYCLVDNIVDAILSNWKLPSQEETGSCRGRGLSILWFVTDCEH
jgi:hypothetical protein